jgi:hypothetical protein
MRIRYSGVEAQRRGLRIELLLRALPQTMPSAAQHTRDDSRRGTFGKKLLVT